jgi:hypothetical protein
MKAGAGGDHAVAMSLLSCVTIRPGYEEVNAPIARWQRTSATRLRSMRLPEPLDDLQFVLIFHLRS